MASRDLLHRLRLARAGLIFAVSLSVASCSTDSHRPLITIELQSTVEVQSQTSIQILEKMRSIMADNQSLRPSVEDLLFLAEAKVAEDQGKFEEAEAFYLEALRRDRGASGKFAFDHWAAIQAKLDATRGHNPDFLATKLLLATLYGEQSPWLKRQNLTTKVALAMRLEKLIAPKREDVPSSARQQPELPDPASFPASDDIYLEARAKAVCKVPIDTRWVGWVSSLSLAQRTYWNGLLLNCAGEPRKAATEFLQAIATLSPTPDDTARAVRSAELLIVALKAIGDRVGATEAYATQASLLKRKDLPLDLLNWSVYEHQKRFIDSSYWLARNRAMQGDYTRARQAVDDGLEGLGLLQDLVKTAKEQTQITELRVEGLHVLSSRIHYEQQDLAGAIRVNQMALAVPNITKDWRHRFLWAEGWYEYRKGDKARAVEAFDVFLKDDIGDSNRSKALYWRGRSHWELGDRSKAEADFEELSRLAPLSFYAIVGVPAVDSEANWTSHFKSADEERLSKIEGFEWGAYREDPEALRRFHRLEFAVASRFKSLYSGLGSELFESVNGRPKLLREVEPSLYATRLMHMAEQYALSISLSSSLSQINSGLWHDYPEQLLVFFPEALREDVVKFAIKNALEPELVWALTRQESSFRTTVESPAGAIGLMQVMPNTAHELARSLGISTSGISSRLKEPDFNLQLGTLYLARLGKRYEAKWPRAIAAYNAGEYVVDTWMLRRDAPDLITWSEALSFSETSSYVKNVWRNWEVYRWLRERR